MYVAREGTDAFANSSGLKEHQNLTEPADNGFYLKVTSSLILFSRIDWTKSGTSIATIKYTYLKSGSSNGAYIEYGLTSSSFNAYFTIHYFNTTLGRFSDVNIEWNTSSKDGRIKSSDYLDGLWQCWDSNRVNKTCP